ncbi:MAG: flagellar basal body-associated FliL family protein [Hydrogenophaga sp.]|jgi:flagellar FliL protein|nr:flagellar basal body-associated FliL family protein [Hydrogenophaga sp.]
MSAATAAAPTAEAAPKKKGKKLLFVIIGVVVLALAGAGGALFLLKKNAAEDAELEEEEAVVKPVDPKTAPTFLPLDNMVVNLADPGGNRYIQVGLTLQLQDSATGDAVKAFMPSIRSQVLLLLSRSTSEEVLSAEGKEKLGKDIIAAVSEVMGYPMPKEASEGEGKKKRGPASPVQAVLFSSFIVQ